MEADRQRIRFRRPILRHVTIPGVKRLRRIAWNGLTVMSALLCVATVVLSLHTNSHSHNLGIIYHATSPALVCSFAVDSCEGLLEWQFSYRTILFEGDEERPPLHFTSGQKSRDDTFSRMSKYDADNYWRHYGFSVEKTANGFNDNINLLTFPASAAVIFFALLPAIRFARWLRRRHPLQQGRCLLCGYDLRATPNRCPECGKTPPKT